MLTCQAMVLVDPYADGKLGFWIYEQFWEMVVEAELYTKRQHTPNLYIKRIKVMVYIYQDMPKITTKTLLILLLSYVEEIQKWKSIIYIP